MSETRELPANVLDDEQLVVELRRVRRFKGVGGEVLADGSGRRCEEREAEVARELMERQGKRSVR